jgi:cysteinyl-tRNA synthetase
VKFVRNITDIDDKIINRSRELNIPWQELVRQYIDKYYRDLCALGIDKADCEPRATENIADMIRHIELLLEKGFAYVTDSGVYFCVRKFKDYGKLSGQSIDQMLAGAEKEPDETKEDPLDFALWKSSRPGEPSWESPWGRGRPGWHIECSTMSMRYLNSETLDIHAGGRDLIFPHHENEIAQSEALTQRPFARYWMHHGLLTINGQKMAKSLGNFVTIKDFGGRYPCDVLKLFFLQTHYSQPIDFSWEIMEEKRKALYGIINFLDAVRRVEEGAWPVIKTPLTKPISPKELRDKIRQAHADFKKAMDDDFNTPNALRVLFEIKNVGRRVLCDVGFKKEFISPLKFAKETIEEFGRKIFGFGFEETPLIIPRKEIEMFIELRKKLRKEKRYGQADQIRKKLEEKGITLEDIGEDTIWERKI